MIVGRAASRPAAVVPRASVMDDSGNVWEKRAMWRALDHHRVGGALDSAQRSPTARDHSSEAGLLYRIAHHSGQMDGIGADAAAETDVDRGRSRGQEAFKIGIQRFRVGSIIPQPVACGDRVRRPVQGCGHQAWAIAVEGLCRRQWAATRKGEAGAPPVANHPA
jgi:hypothetical protein